jgi:hypothetical protein
MEKSISEHEAAVILKSHDQKQKIKAILTERRPPIWPILPALIASCIGYVLLIKYTKPVDFHGLLLGLFVILVVIFIQIYSMSRRLDAAVNMITIYENERN